MPRKPLKKLKKVPEIKEWQIQILRDGIYPKAEKDMETWFFYYEEKSKDHKLELYESIREGFLKKWIAQNPCTRPWCWYRYDAPRWDDPFTTYYYHGTLPEERKHISGGRRCRYNYVPAYYKGTFRYWHFDNGDIPLIESEGAYLKRFDLLTKEEKGHLKNHPELLDPVMITDAVPGIQSQE